MAKNQPNYLKIWHMMYLYGFYWFPKFWKISLIFGRFLAKKLYFFQCSRVRFEEKKFRRKNVHVLWKLSNWPKNWYTCTLGPLLDLHKSFFGFFVFLPFYGSRNAQKGIFLVNFLYFWQNLLTGTFFLYFGAKTHFFIHFYQNNLPLTLPREGFFGKL